MTTPAVELIPLDRSLINLLLDNAASVYPGCTVSADDRPTLRDAVLKARDFGGGFLAVDAGSRRVIGTCAYKGAPSAEEGAVEISCFTFPPHRGKGYGTAMVRVLEKSGFSPRGNTDAPEDGRVWLWKRKL